MSGYHMRGRVHFNATSEEMSETFHIETDNYTCYLEIQVNLYENGSWYSHHLGHDNFRFDGPCEEPPSPFSLTYDGMEYEMDFEYDTFENCTDSDGDEGWECEYEDYDWDGDGEPDVGYTWFPQCEYSDEDMLWYCEVGMAPPMLEEGNHTMVLTIEDLEVGSNYSVEWDYETNNRMSGYSYDSGEFHFSATSEEMSETFHIETDNYTCHLDLSFDLYEEMDGWGHQIAHGQFHFRAPCEEPPSPFNLTYDGMEYEMDFEMSPTMTAPRRGWAGNAR